MDEAGGESGAMETLDAPDAPAVAGTRRRRLHSWGEGGERGGEEGRGAGRGGGGGRRRHRPRRDCHRMDDGGDGSARGEGGRGAGGLGGRHRCWQDDGNDSTEG